MDKELELRLQAWVDGELSPPESEVLSALVEKDPEAAAYTDSLRQTRETLQLAHSRSSSGRDPWQALEARLDQPAPRYGNRLISFPQALTAVAALLLLSLVLYIPFRDHQPKNTGETAETPGLDSAVYLVETDLENATPIVYIDQPSGWTLIWVAEQDDTPEKG